MLTHIVGWGAYSWGDGGGIVVEVHVRAMHLLRCILSPLPPRVNPSLDKVRAILDMVCTHYITHRQN